MNITFSKKYLLPQLAAASAINLFEKSGEIILTAKSKNVPFLKMYEALLQNYLFAGFPSALTSLKILKEYYPNKRLTKVQNVISKRSRINGEELCRKVYGDKFEKLIKNINDFSPELAEWLVLEGYGKVLGRSGLTLKERELCVVAVLAATKFEDQLYSHINGAMKTGASTQEIESIIQNLDLFGIKNLSVFGLNVLNRFKNEREVY